MTSARRRGERYSTKRSLQVAGVVAVGVVATTGTVALASANQGQNTAAAADKQCLQLDRKTMMAMWSALMPAPAMPEGSSLGSAWGQPTKSRTAKEAGSTSSRKHHKSTHKPSASAAPVPAAQAQASTGTQDGAAQQAMSTYGWRSSSNPWSNPPQVQLSKLSVVPCSSSGPVSPPVTSPSGSPVPAPSDTVAPSVAPSPVAPVPTTQAPAPVPSTTQAPAPVPSTTQAPPPPAPTPTVTSTAS